MRRSLAGGLTVLALLGAASVAFAARPASPAQRATLQRSIRFWFTRGPNQVARRAIVEQACASTVVPGFAVAIVSHLDLGVRPTLVLLHRNPRLATGWGPYDWGAPHRVWFNHEPSNPRATRLFAEHDLYANCGLPAWAKRR